MAETECCAILEPVDAWPVPVPTGWAQIRCLCGFVSMPMPQAVAEQMRSAHERGPTLGGPGV